jgi:hypothetical protein
LNTQRILAAVLLALGLAAGNLALASRIPGDVILGPVTSVTSQSVTIQGQEYHIRQGTPAAAAVSHISPGQSVEVHLDGPASSSHSEVINVLPRK